MDSIQTPSFTLSIYIQGNPDASQLALVLPGKLDTKDYSHMHSHVDYLSRLGFLALSFDPPGTWESGEDINLYTTTNYIKATQELIKHFNRPTFVIGHSLGGTIAMIVGSQNPQVTHFGSIMSFYSFNPQPNPKNINLKWQSEGVKISHRDDPFSTESRKFQLPYRFLEDLIQYDVSKSLNQSFKPKIFILGQKDVVVSPQIVKSAYEISAHPKELYELNINHRYRDNPHSIEQVNREIGEFLAKYSF